MRPSLTLTYGMSWGLSMPPYEINGKQVPAKLGSDGYAVIYAVSDRLRHQTRMTSLDGTLAL